LHDNKLMPNNLHKQQGFALVAVLISIVIIAALFYGSSFFWSEKGTSIVKTQIEVKNRAEKEIGEIQKQIIDRNEQIKKLDLNKDDFDTSKWRTYKKEDFFVQVDYHKDWYFRRDSENEKKYGYQLYVGFAESMEKLESSRGYYPIELIVVGVETEPGGEFGKKISVLNEEHNGKRFYINTPADKIYLDLADKMKETFVYLNN